jgi:hypothetical protein
MQRANNFSEYKYSPLKDQDIELPITQNSQIKKANDSVLILDDSNDESEEEQEVELPNTHNNQINTNNEDNEFFFDEYQDTKLTITHNNRKQNNRNEDKLRANNLPKDSVLIPVDSDDESDVELLLIDSDDASDDSQNKIITTEKKFTINSLPNEMLYKILEDMHKQITHMSSDDLLLLLRFSQTSHRMNDLVKDLAKKTGLARELLIETKIHSLKLTHHVLREKLADCTPNFDGDNARSVCSNESTSYQALAIGGVTGFILMVAAGLYWFTNMHSVDDFIKDKTSISNMPAIIGIVTGAIIGTGVICWGITSSCTGLVKMGLFCNKQSVETNRQKINEIRNQPSSSPSG